MYIKTFLKNNCGNFDSQYQCCVLSDKDCLVLAGKQCGYFEKFLLGPFDYRFRLPGVDYAKLAAQYAELTGAGTRAIVQRFCECGQPLGYRQRVCSKCRLQARKAAYRKNRKSKSLMRNS